jgi:predicted  nucleic acid-binding Zn-ribbon protein
MSAALGLFRLQQVDRQMDQALARLNVIQQTLDNDSELRAVLDQVEAAKAEEARAEKSLREAEAAVQSQQVKIEQAESSLYGGRVHNPKELQDLQSDIAALKRFLSTLEERQLESMLAAETAQAALQRAESALTELQSRRGSEHSLLVGEQASLSKKVERLQVERQGAAYDIPATSRELYERLRQQRRGIAVAEVTDNTCSACGTPVTAALQQSARSTTQLIHCSSCGRILYAN